MSHSNDYTRYFSEFLPTIYGEQLVEDLKDLNACFELAVRDADEAPWRIVVEKGCLVYAGHDGPEPGCRFDIDAETLVKILSAEESPQDAFFDMRIDVSGDEQLGMIVSAVIEPFFQRFPLRRQAAG